MHTSAHWVDKLDAAVVPGGPVYGYADVMNDPQVKARKMVVDIDHPRIGAMKMLGLPLKATGPLTEIRQPAPWLGQHTQDTMQIAGYGSDEIARLFEERVIFDAQRTADPAVV